MAFSLETTSRTVCYCSCLPFPRVSYCMTKKYISYACILIHGIYLLYTHTSTTILLTQTMDRFSHNFQSNSVSFLPKKADNIWFQFLIGNSLGSCNVSKKPAEQVIKKPTNHREEPPNLSVLSFWLLNLSLGWLIPWNQRLATRKLQAYYIECRRTPCHPSQRSIPWDATSHVWFNKVWLAL